MTALGRFLTEIMGHIAPDRGKLSLWVRQRSGLYCATLAIPGRAPEVVMRKRLADTLDVLHAKLFPLGRPA